MSDEQAVEVSELKVELKRHRGVRQTGIGPVTVDLGQSIVVVNGRHAGYVADAPGSHISLISSGLPDEVLAHIKSEVDRLRNQPSSVIVQAAEVEESNVQVSQVDDEESLV